MEKTYFWIKVSDEFFKQKEMKKLRKVAGGDTYTIIYLKMLLLAAKQNNKLYFDGVEDNFAEELAMELDEELDNIKMTLSFLQRYRLIEIISHDEYELTRCDEMVGQLSDTALRKRRSREKQKQLACDNVTKESHYIEIDKDKELDINKDIEEDKKEVEIINELVERYNSIEGVTKCISLTKKRSGLIKARIKEYGLDIVLEVLGKVEESNFLRGQNDRKFKVSIDWVFDNNKFVYILEDRYKNKQQPKQPIEIIANVGDLF